MVILRRKQKNLAEPSFSLRWFDIGGAHSQATLIKHLLVDQLESEVAVRLKRRSLGFVQPLESLFLRSSNRCKIVTIKATFTREKIM